MLPWWLNDQEASQLAVVVKNLPANAGDVKRHGFDPWIGRIPWSRKWQPTPVFLPGKFPGWRSLAGYSPWGHKESAMIKVTEDTQWKIPWSRKWQPTPVFVPRKFHAHRSLLGYSPWGCKRVRHHLVTKQR